MIPRTILTRSTIAQPLFDPIDLRRHRFGVNYVPSKSWYYCYNDWNLNAISHDMDRIADVGADHIRVMVIWPWFHPNPKMLSAAHLDRLDQLFECAAERNLDILPSIYTGWLSGYHFNPNFYESEPFFTSEKWADAQSLYLNGIASRMQHHFNFLGFDAGNEIDYNWPCPSIVGDAWLSRLFQQMNVLLPDKLHVNGVSHTPWFSDHSFSAETLVAQQPIVPLHCWPYWAGAGLFGGPLDKPYTHLSAGMATLARSLGREPEKPIWIQEFGVCSLEMPENDVPNWLEASVSNAVDNGVSWFTWWASHDINRNYNFHPFEYNLGLITAGNKIKEQGRKFKRLADHYRQRPVPPVKAIPPPPTKRTKASTWAWLLDWMEWKRKV